MIKEAKEMTRSRCWSRSSPKSYHLLSLSRFPEHFIKIHPWQKVFFFSYFSDKFTPTKTLPKKKRKKKRIVTSLTEVTKHFLLLALWKTGSSFINMWLPLVLSILTFDKVCWLHGWNGCVHEDVTINTCHEALSLT